MINLVTHDVLSRKGARGLKKRGGGVGKDLTNFPPEITRKLDEMSSTRFKLRTDFNRF